MTTSISTRSDRGAFPALLLILLLASGVLTVGCLPLATPQHTYTGEPFQPLSRRSGGLPTPAMVVQVRTAAAPSLAPWQQHGSYSIEGYGIHGPPATSFTVQFKPGGSSIPLATSTGSAQATRLASLSPTGSVSPTQSASSTVTPAAAPSDTASLKSTTEEKKRQEKEAKGRETFAKKLRAPPKWFRLVNGEKGKEDAEAVVDQLVQKSGMSGRRARQLVVNSLATNDTATLERYGVGRDLVPTAAPTAQVATNWSDSTRPLQLAPTAKGTAFLALSSTSLSYSIASVRADLHLIRAWAGDLHTLSTPALFDETVAAILSASARYYPDLPTLAACRVIMADILAESDFRHDMVAGPRLDSGSAWGLMQVSPYGSGQELKLYKQHSVSDANVYSWGPPGTTAREGRMGPLLDWKTGKQLDLAALKTEDLLRPWVNIHVASWVQSNLARTGSQDPYAWTAIGAASSRALNLTASSSPSSSSSSSRDEAAKAWTQYDKLISAGAKGVSRSFKTGLGSWVAGPADGKTGYLGTQDDISSQYFKRIAQGLSVLYGAEIKPEWLDTLLLRPGLIDFR